MRMELDATLFESTVAGMVGGDGMGRNTLAAAALSLHHLPQRSRRADRLANQLVAGGASDRLVKGIEVWPGVRRQGRDWRQSGSAPLQQKGNAHHGRHSDCAGAQCDHASLGAVEHADPTEPSISSCFDRTGLLRRLRKNHSTERRWNALSRKA